VLVLVLVLVLVIEWTSPRWTAARALQHYATTPVVHSL